MTSPAEPPRDAPRVRLVVLNFNGGEMVLRCLRHLEALEWPADRLELVVVDNASSDGSPERIAAEHPTVRIVHSGANLGFPANNLALADLDGIDYAGLVNNDAFVEPGWLAPLVAALDDDPGLGAVSGRMLFEPSFVPVRLEVPTFRPPGDPRHLGVQVLGVRAGGADVWARAQLAGGCHPIEDGPDGPFAWTSGTAEVRVPVAPGGEDGPVIELCLAAPGPVTVRALTGAGAPVELAVGTEPAWIRVPAAGPAFDVVNNAGSLVYEDGYGADRGYLEPDGPEFDEPAEVFAWCGGGVLLRPTYLARVGLLEERFFLYYEDTDLSWRGQGAGWRYRYVPTARMRHVHSATAVEGSPTFTHYVDRNRLLMLVRCAPRGLAARQVGRAARAVLTGVVRDVVRPVLRGRRPAVRAPWRRARAFAAFCVRLPWALRTRRAIRAGWIVPDAELVRRLTPR